MKGFTHHASQGMWCARGTQGMHSSEGASTSLQMHLKMRESAAWGRQQGPAIEENMESRLEGTEQDTGRRSAGRTATFKGKEPNSPCCPLIYLFLGGILLVFQPNSDTWHQWPAHGHTEKLAEQSQAQCITIAPKPQGRVAEQRQAMQCLPVHLI